MITSTSLTVWITSSGSPLNHVFWCLSWTLCSLVSSSACLYALTLTQGLLATVFSPCYCQLWLLFENATRVFRPLQYLCKKNKKQTMIEASPEAQYLINFKMTGPVRSFYARSAAYSCQWVVQKTDDSLLAPTPLSRATYVPSTRWLTHLAANPISNPGINTFYWFSSSPLWNDASLCLCKAGCIHLVHLSSFAKKQQLKTRLIRAVKESTNSLFHLQLYLIF